MTCPACHTPLQPQAAQRKLRFNIFGTGGMGVSYVCPSCSTCLARSYAHYSTTSKILQIFLGIGLGYLAGYLLDHSRLPPPLQYVILIICIAIIYHIGARHARFRIEKSSSPYWKLDKYRTKPP